MHQAVFFKSGAQSWLDGDRKADIQFSPVVLRVFAACQPNSLDGSKGLSDWKTHELGTITSKALTLQQHAHNLLRTGVSVPAANGRQRCQRTGCVLGIRWGTGRPSALGGGQAPFSEAEGRLSSLTCWIFHAEPSPAHREQMEHCFRSNHNYRCYSALCTVSHTTVFCKNSEGNNYIKALAHT